MPLEISILIPADKLNDTIAIRKEIESHIGHISNYQYRIQRRSIDARQPIIKYQLKLGIYTSGEEIPDDVLPPMPLKNVQSEAKHVIIIGAGPAGLFAALRAIELGMKPIILERGKNVRERRRDLAAINKEHIVNPESNYCFGEGGAGTYSDGKLYTRSTKRGDVLSVFRKFVQFGAPDTILIDAHPHIGTNKLPAIIEAIRNYILARGGEIHFNTKVIDFEIENKQIRYAITDDGRQWQATAYVLATGHSARDIFEMIHRKKMLVEFKSFALGVRAEHLQSTIDNALYRSAERPEYLPPAAYSLVEQVDGRGVYSFCMCPGGIIAPCATQEGEIVTNGWSPSKRNNPFANSGIVVPIYWEDIPEYHMHGPLAGMYFQRDVEQRCWQAAGKTQKAPAQRMIDFVNKKKSTSLPKVSYQPGITSILLDDVLPEFVAKRLRKAFPLFGKKLKGYYTNEAVLVATESRTSSPVRIPRLKEECCHPEVENLYPCGEGAGYAGGIASAAIDGERVMSAIAHKYLASR